ncbi:MULTISPECIES: glycerophosphodiester phosphodiesterase [unclassified Parvimonas]|uniref:glycerophosphodiester phosphodiesterase n=1 Tax=unclassified Parvimonas TaxID=1151464 RepID=UPI002B4997C6|nr:MULTISPECIES: glycerophosphodiester phosphodiesterase [unclassified Parvimonas]MEB3024512.1 glycerophosphodiester phosphodiesterase [Parvimonas sp. M13]MEB3088658.1 glycerophosphodiester phosphodiesterase [Parvimonas sp. M20]
MSLFLLILILTIYILLQFSCFKKERKARKVFRNGDFPLVFAHRGSSHLFPENTELAFTKSFEMGVDAFETDIRLTKDGKIVTQHNEDIDETTNGTGNVIDYTYDELKEFNFGYKFKDINGDSPYVDNREYGLFPMEVSALFEKFGDKVVYSIDVKDEGEIGLKSAELLYKFVKEYNLEKNVIFSSFSEDNLKHLRKISHGEIIISGSMKKTTEVVLASYFGYDSFKKFNTHAMMIPKFEKLPLDTKYLIYKFHKHNISVCYWTINTEKDMRKLINKKVDGIITDRVDLILKIKEEKSN